MSKSNRFRGVALSLSFLAALKVGTAAPLDVATSYDIFLYGANGTTSISQLTVNGGVAVGNNLTVSNANISNSDGPFALISAKNIAVSGSTINGAVAYGGAVAINSASLSNSPVQSTPIDFVTVGQGLIAASQSFAGLVPSGTSVFQFGGYTLNGTDATLNVFQVSAANLAGSNYMNLTAPAGSTVIINVTGSAASLGNMGINLNGPSASKVIFNFSEATTVSFNSVNVPGTVLAPNANITFIGGQAAGSLIANSGSFSNVYFGDADFTGNINVTTSSTPEPSTYALMGMSLLGLGLIQRRFVMAKVRK